MLLARYGLRVLVAERARYGSDTVSTHALMRGGVLQLQRWGLLDRILAAETPTVSRVLFHYPDETVCISLKPTGDVRALYAPRRTVLDRILADAAIAAGADVRFQTTMTEILRHASGRVIGIAARDSTGRLFNAYAPITIGADGMRSSVARAVAAPVVHAAKRGGTFLYGYWDDLPTEGYEWFYSPETSAGLIPTNDGQTLVFVGTTAERMHALRAAGSGEAFDNLLQTASLEAWRRVSDARPPESLRGFAGESGYLRQASGPGWALVGDAGAFEDPLGTHGITDAFRDAELLAAAVRDYNAGVANDTDALTGYQNRRNQMAGRMFTVVDAIGSYNWTMATLRPLLLEASAAMTEQVEALQGLHEGDRIEAVHAATDDLETPLPVGPPHLS
jgi:flavin-dependent dehydrogenase